MQRLGLQPTQRPPTALFWYCSAVVLWQCLLQAPAMNDNMYYAAVLVLSTVIFRGVASFLWLQCGHQSTPGAAALQALQRLQMVCTTCHTGQALNSKPTEVRIKANH